MAAQEKPKGMVPASIALLDDAQTWGAQLGAEIVGVPPTRGSINRLTGTHVYTGTIDVDTDWQIQARAARFGQYVGPILQDFDRYWGVRAGELQSAYDFSPVYRNRRDCAEALDPAIRRDIQDLVAAGCDYIQIEEPHAKRTYRWLSPALLDANVHGFSLEFGAREMAEIDLVGKWDRERVLSAGLIDIETHYCETPEDIIERVCTCLEYRDPERLEISTDCGLRRVPRYLAISKMSAATEAARRLRASG